MSKYHSGKCDCDLCREYSQTRLESFYEGILIGIIGIILGMGLFTISLIILKGVLF